MASDPEALKRVMKRGQAYSFDTLLSLTSLPPSRLGAALTVLELQKKVQRKEGRYVLAVSRRST